MLTYAHVCSRMLTYAHVCSPGMAAGMFADPSKMQNSAGVPAPSHWYTNPEMGACPHYFTHTLLTLYSCFTRTVLILDPFFLDYFTHFTHFTNTQQVCQPRDGPGHARVFHVSCNSRCKWTRREHMYIYIYIRVDDHTVPQGKRTCGSAYVA